jgi:hypothetical protein
MSALVHHPPSAPFAPPPWPWAPAQPAPFPPAHLIYDPATLVGQVLTVAGNAFTALILLCMWVGLAAVIGLALAAFLHRYAGGMTGREAALTATVLLTAGYVINGITFWQRWPSVTALVTAMVLAAMRLSPATPGRGRVQGFWAGRLLAYSPGRRPSS